MICKQLVHIWLKTVKKKTSGCAHNYCWCIAGKRFDWNKSFGSFVQIKMFTAKDRDIFSTKKYNWEVKWFFYLNFLCP